MVSLWFVSHFVSHWVLHTLRGVSDISDTKRLADAINGLAVTRTEIMTERLKALADVLAQRIAHQTLEPMLTKKQAVRYCFTAVRFQRTSFPQRKLGKS